MKFFIEGNIGSGKTTLVNYLKSLEIFKEKNINTVLEPVEEWKSFKDSEDKNLLEYFYSDPKRWSYLFQMNAFITRGKLIEEQDGILLMERSVYSDRNVFAKNCYEKGLINEIEWKTYVNWFDWLSKIKCKWRCLYLFTYKSEKVMTVYKKSEARKRDTFRYIKKYI